MSHPESRSEAFARGRRDCEFHGYTTDELLSARYYACLRYSSARAYWLGVVWESRYHNPLILRRFNVGA